MKMPARAKSMGRRGDMWNLLASVLSVEQDMKSSMENEVNRGKKDNLVFFFWSKGKAQNNCCGKWKRELVMGQAKGLTRSIQGLAEVDPRWNACAIFSVKHDRLEVEGKVNAYMGFSLR